MTGKVRVEEKNFAFQNRLQTFSVINENHTDIREFFNEAYLHFSSRINSILDEYYIIKVSACFVANFEKVTLTQEGEQKETQKMYLNTCVEMIDFESDLHTFYNDYIVSPVNVRIDEVAIRGSGFSLAQILELNIQVSSFDPYSGSTYVSLPKFLQKKRAVINVKNNDEKCFMYAVLSALFPNNNNPQRVDKYLPYVNSLNFKGIKFPVELKQITIFEHQNQSISINVYMYEDESKKVRPLRLAKQIKTNHIHLLLLTQNSGKAVGIKSHYCWIKNLSALIGSQISSNCAKKYFCDRCLNYFHLFDKLEQHKAVCSKLNEYQIVMPSFKENIMEFRNHKNKLKVPFIIYADVESILKKPVSEFSKADTTVAYQQHEVHSVGYYFKCMHDDSQSFYKSERGLNCIEWFIEELNGIVKKVDLVLNRPKPLNMSMEDEVLFIMSDDCHICGVKFHEDERRVRDHSHITGEFRGAAHPKCNLEYQEAFHIPVVFHNLSNYDAHFIIKALAVKIPGEISIIPRNDQRYISFTKTVPSLLRDQYQRFIKLRFIDSFQFMASSLDYLSSLLSLDEKRILKSEFEGFSDE